MEPTPLHLRALRALATLPLRWLGRALRTAWPALLALAAAVPAHSQSSARIVAWAPGDLNMPAAMAAAARLKADPSLAMVQIRLLPVALIEARDVEAAAPAHMLIVHPPGGPSLARTLTPAIQQILARGGKAYQVGSSFETFDKEAGYAFDTELRAYSMAGGADNYEQMLRHALHRDWGLGAPATAVRPIPESALWNPRSNRIHEDFDGFAADVQAKAPAALRGKPWVAVVFNRGQATGGSAEVVRAVCDALEARGLNAAPVFGFPVDKALERLFIDAQGRSRLVAIAAVGMKFGNIPEKTLPILERLDAPVVNAITLYKASREEWEKSPTGLDTFERSWQVASTEFASAIAPTVIASKERRADKASGLSYVAEVPMPERVARYADRIRKLVDLRTTANAGKRVAIVYYNYPPGKENVGASYLNVLARSLWQMLARLEQEGYDTTRRPADETQLFDRLRDHGTNIGNWAPGALAELVASGQAQLLPVSEYKAWFARLPESLRGAMVRTWGEPEKSNVMVWRDKAGKPYFVFPAQRFGNVLFAPQPSRGWEQDIKKAYHDVTLPPHHQYLAFYLWLQRDYDAHAMVHVGTHATHEWLSGKEIGFTPADPPELMVGAVPQVYPYIVDVVGEGLQAKRRGMATIVSHMTPPFAKAGLNPDLTALKGLLDDYGVATQNSESATQAVLAQINQRASKMGALKDVGLKEVRGGDDVESLQHYLKEVGELQSPFGLHTFGVVPAPKARRSTAEGMADRLDGLKPAERERAIAEYLQVIEASGKAELDAFVAGLNGRFVTAGPGGDPLRVPASLPTGKNFFGFNPAAMPSPGVYAQGAAMAEKLVADHRQKHGQYPDRLLFNLWSNEAMRHGGLMEAQILALLGVKLTYHRWGAVDGIEVIPRAKLGRPRVDVTVIPSGLYRDALPNLMVMLDQAVDAVRKLDEPDNVVRVHVAATKKKLEESGVAPELAERMAAVRLFTEPPGAYGTGLDNVIMASNTWTDEKQVAEVYFNRVGHLFGQGFWGDKPVSAAVTGELFKGALKDVKAVVHSRATNLYGTLDNDDVFQYLGGAALAVRAAGGASPEVLIANLRDPKNSRTESLDKFIGQEMRSRYLNPTWIDAMLKEGYAGARFVHQVTDNLWGWQVTVPEAVDAAKWQEMFETYVQDKHRLDIKNRFRQAKNLLAYQAMVDRMLVAVNKGYWEAAPETVAELNRVNREVIAEAGAACHHDSCSSEEVSRVAEAIDRAKLVTSRGGYGLSAPAAPSPAATTSPPPAAPAQAAPPAPKPPDTVRGQQLKEVPLPQQIQQLIWAYGWMLGAVLLAGMGWQAWRTRREARPLPPTVPNPSTGAA